MTARIKLLGRMDVVEKRRPQDGRIKTAQPARRRGRDAPVHAAHGLRREDGDAHLRPRHGGQDLAALGFARTRRSAGSPLIARPHGIILVTGPTGSGKTTTLYSTLKRLATDEVNVCTVEDPIEMIEPAFNQTQVQRRWTWALPKACAR
jgi:general secretion pathway protein E